MNKYFKKFSIMFVMLLEVIGIGMIQNATVANAATVGQKLTQAEDGWRRFNNKDANISYQGSWGTWDRGDFYASQLNASSALNATIKFNFYGTKLRIIDEICNNRSKNHSITIDGIEENLSEFSGNGVSREIAYEKLGLSNMGRGYFYLYYSGY